MSPGAQGVRLEGEGETSGSPVKKRREVQAEGLHLQKLQVVVERSIYWGGVWEWGRWVRAVF